MNTLTIQNHQSVVVAIDDKARLAKESALLMAEDIKSVGSEWEAQIAAESVKALKAILSEVEASRQQVKKPVLELGRTIDTLANDYTKDVHSEVTRLSGLVNKFMAEERAKAEAAERARQEAIRKAQQEEMARQQELARIERERQKAEDAAKAKDAAIAFEMQKQVIELQRQQLALQSQAKTIQSVAAVRVASPEGVKTKDVIKFEVVNIRELYLAHPELVRIEPNTSAINRALGDGSKPIAGLKIWTEQVAIIR